MKQFTRKEILERFRKKIANHDAILLGGAGIGLIASIADKAGIDMIMAYCTGPFRMDGMPSVMGRMPYSNSNEETIKLARMLKLVENTPVAAGVSPQDPHYQMEHLVDKLLDLGYSAITNVPSVSGYTRDYSPENNIWRQRIEDGGLGIEKEVEMVEYCSKRDIFTVVYAYSEEDVRRMVGAGADAIGLHIGGTSGGDVGIRNVPTMDEACEKTQRLYEVAIAENPNVITLAHGGPLEGPNEVRECLSRTFVHGFIGASSVERFPVERAIYDEVRRYKELHLR